MEKVNILERPLAGMSLICILPEFLDGLKLGMLKNYTKTLKMMQLLKTKWLGWAVFTCIRLETDLYLF